MDSKLSMNIIILGFRVSEYFMTEVRVSDFLLYLNALLYYLWQSRIEIEYYSVVYFERITEFDTL